MRVARCFQSRRALRLVRYNRRIRVERNPERNLHVEIVQRATKAAPDAFQVLELGGKGEISDRDYRVNDVPVRGF